MKNIIRLFIVSIAVIITACNNKQSDLYNLNNLSKKDIKLTRISLDSFFLKGIYTSGIGNVVLNHDKLLFVDKVFCSVFQFTLDGEFLESKLDKGRGPDQVSGINEFTVLSSGYFIMDESWGIYTLDSNWIKKEVNRVNFKTKKELSDLKNNPQPSDRGIYEVEYLKNIIRPLDEKRVLFPVTVEHPSLNGFFAGCEEYYNNCAILGILNVENGEVEQLIGKRSPVFLEQKYIPNFNRISYDINGKDIIISYEPDSALYIYNIIEGYKYKFGNRGRDMNTNYRRTTSFEASEDNLHDDRLEFGYYTFVEYIEQTQLLFRGYQKGESQNDGLQIYKDKTLIADIDVPKGFKIIGYSNNYYFAQGLIDEINEIIPMYKFKIEL